MLPGQNSNSYSTQGWLAQIYELLEGGICGGNMQNGIIINQNSVIINGTAFFVTNTKPTTRIDGSALVAGDRWYNTNEGTEWFWNGSYWLSTNFVDTYLSGTVTSTGYTTSDSDDFVSLDNFGTINYQYFIEKLKFRYYLATADASNYWDVRLRFGMMTATGFSNALDPTIFSLTTSGTYLLEHDYNLYRSTPNASTINHGFLMTKVGTPSNLLFSAVLRLRNVV